MPRDLLHARRWVIRRHCCYLKPATLHGSLKLVHTTLDHRSACSSYYSLAYRTLYGSLGGMDADEMDPLEHPNMRLEVLRTSTHIEDNFAFLTRVHRL